MEKIGSCPPSVVAGLGPPPLIPLDPPQPVVAALQERPGLKPLVIPAQPNRDIPWASRPSSLQGALQKVAAADEDLGGLAYTQSLRKINSGYTNPFHLNSSRT